MKDNGKTLIAKIKETCGKYKWYGWTHRLCRSRYYGYAIGRNFTHLVCATILPDSFIKILIRFVYLAPYHEEISIENLDINKDFCYVELIIEDETQLYGQKKIFSLTIAKNEKDGELLKDLFLEIKNKTTFRLKKDEIRVEEKIIELISLL